MLLPSPPYSHSKPLCWAVMVSPSWHLLGMLRALCPQMCTAPVAAVQHSKEGPWQKEHAQGHVATGTQGDPVAAAGTGTPCVGIPWAPSPALSHQLRECSAGDHLHTRQLVNLLGEGIFVLGLCPALPVAAAEPLLPPWLPTAPAQQYRTAHRAAPTCSTAHQCCHIAPARTNCQGLVPAVLCACALAHPHPLSQEQHLRA